MEHLTTIIVALIGGGLVSLVQFLIQRSDAKDDKLKGIMDAIGRLERKIDSVDEKGDERNAVAMRVRILRFRDEMLEGKGHSHDAFQQVLRDIDEYEEYCVGHPGFKNNQTVSTVEHIKRNYAERLEKHDFL